MQKLDAANRRIRGVRQSNGSQVDVNNPRLLTWLQILNQHGWSTVPHLHLFTPQYKGAKTAQAMATRFFHNGGYLDTPREHELRGMPKCSNIIYSISLDGEEILRANDLYKENTPESSGWWEHDYVRSIVTQAIHIGCLNNGLEYIPHHEIVERVGTHMFDVHGATLKPDALLGIKYPDGRAHLFCLEVNMGGEQVSKPGSTTKKNKKTMEGALELYDEFIGKGAYKRYFGNDTSLLLLNVFARGRQMQNVMDLSVRKHGGNNYTLYKHIKHAAPWIKPPKPFVSLIDEPFLRAGRGDFYIHGKNTA